MAISLGFDLFENIFSETLFFGNEWLLGIILVLITMVMISRDPNEYKSLAFPVAVGWHIIGLTPGLLFLLITSIPFVIAMFSQYRIGAVMNTIRGVTTDVTSSSFRYAIPGSEKRRLKKEMKRKLTKQTMFEELKTSFKEAKETKKYDELKKSQDKLNIKMGARPTWQVNLQQGIADLQRRRELKKMQRIQYNYLNNPNKVSFSQWEKYRDFLEKEKRKRKR